MLFEWDEAKNLSNQEKHGFDFELAINIFSDPKLLIIKSTQESLGEERFVAIGRIIENEPDLLLVVFTIRDKKIRLISAHKPRKKFIKMYNQNICL